ncbi:unnamed protein product [Bemisia tabaci]|uniref:Phosphatidylethanolamine-binding protein n=1 Tax=Bemisia tabaci TaxID=7038 RepID=A0A9P0AA93_BEMTA|nr:PREDICTED: protein D3-like [Bemisia tabaci]CAH0387432.1 unnamed protein product [Bemisia tabaci]
MSVRRRINWPTITIHQMYPLLVTLFLIFKSILAVVELTPEQIREELVKSEIIPDVIVQPPQNVVQVTYLKWFVLKNYVNFGTIIKANKLQSPPASINWPYENNTYYSLILTSPDAPSRASPNLREWQHWIVGNIRKNEWQEGLTLTEYRAPGFVRNTGLHRMVFLVFKQPKKLSFSAHTRRKRVLRSYFSTQVFSAKHNLSIVAANYLQIDCGSPDEETES